MAECEVCYSGRANCNLICGHSFCHSCVKTWYHTGANDGCPMCRKKLYFKRMPIKKWALEADEEKRNSVFVETVEEIYELAVTRELPIRHLRQMIVDIETTFRAMKEYECSPEDIDYVLNETDDYYSDRKIRPMNKRGNFGEPRVHQRNTWDFKNKFKHRR